MKEGSGLTKEEHDSSDRAKAFHLENATRLQAELDSDKFELSSVMKEENNRLMEEGFFGWTRSDLKCFLDAIEKYGTSNMPMLISEVSSSTDKSEDYIDKYCKVFFSRLNELPDYVKLVERIERGNKRMARELEVKKALDLKFSTCTPDDLRIVYGAYRSRIFSETHDKMLIYLIHKHGYGQWEQIRADIRSSPRFQFDWYFKSRTTLELQRRSETILNLVLKEVQGR
jgi:SWI/SNF-related matrix-associated actin-dependent regulator of chromatin subfamily A member 5